MAKVISQDTFDAVVRENIVEFEMEPSEAMQDAAQQFEAQGINLSNIVQEVSAYTGDGKQPVVVALETIQDGCNDIELLISHLKEVKLQCDVDIARRVLAGKSCAFSILLSEIQKHSGNAEVFDLCLDCLLSLTYQQPDIITQDGMRWCLKELENQALLSNQMVGVLKLIKQCCLKHEQNRQSFVASDVIPALMSLLEQRQADPAVLAAAVAVLRVLTLDDDIRATFGKAHEHCQLMVNDHGALRVLLPLCQAHSTDVELLGELLSTVARLAVRNEFCQHIVDLGGLGLVQQVLTNNVDNAKLVQQSVNLLKAVVGNDQVKDAAVNQGLLELTLHALSRHIKSPLVAESCCAALAAVILRKPLHTNKLMELEGPALILRAMQINAGNSRVQKQGCQVLRNLVSRTKEHVAPLLAEGCEDVVRAAMTSHAQECGEEAKAALRDLGCKVELQELWTGTKGQLAQ